MNAKKRYITLKALILLSATGLFSMQNSNQNDVVGDLLQAMQDCITFNQLVTKNNPQLQQVQQQSMWKRAINYIENIRSENKSNVERPDLAQLNQVAFAQNRSEELFSRLLDEILVHYTILSETKGRLYGRIYNLTSVNGENQPILGAHENDFRNILQNGAKQAGWGKSVIVNLPAVQQDGAAIVRSVNLHEIINALPTVGMSTAAKVGLALGAAALGAVALGTYNYLNNPEIIFIQSTSDNQAKKQESNLKPTEVLKEINSLEFFEGLKNLEETVAKNPENKELQQKLTDMQRSAKKLESGDWKLLSPKDIETIGLGTTILNMMIFNNPDAKYTI